MSGDTPRVLSIQSHVVHGYVGNKSAVFPLQVLGFEVDAINTVQFSTHTGYKHIKGTVLSNDEMEELIQGLILNDVDYYTHLITGYSKSPDSLKQTAGVIKRLKEKNPNLVYVCDPVMGDDGRMYVPKESLPVYKNLVVPLADILTPNQYEAELITGMSVRTIDDALNVVQKLHDMGVKTVVLSSSNLGDQDNIISIASGNGVCYRIDIPKFNTQYTGTGDLFASLFLAWTHTTNNDIKLALEKTTATMQSIVRDTYLKAREKQPTGDIPPKLRELRIVQNKTNIENPVVKIQAVKIKG